MVISEQTQSLPTVNPANCKLSFNKEMEVLARQKNSAPMEALVRFQLLIGIVMEYLSCFS